MREVIAVDEMHKDTHTYTRTATTRKGEEVTVTVTIVNQTLENPVVKSIIKYAVKDILGEKDN